MMHKNLPGQPRVATTARYSRACSQPVINLVGMKLAPSASLDLESDGGYDSSQPNRVPRYRLTYLGHILLDRRVTKLMLKWVLAEIRRLKNSKRDGLLTVTGATMSFAAIKDSSDIILQHNVHSVSQFSRCQIDRKCFFYLQRNNIDAPFVMYAFLCDQEDKMVEIFHSIQNATKTTPKPESFSAPVKKSTNIRHFEVKYQGRCHLAEKKKSGVFIDEWLRDKSDLRLRHASGDSLSSRKSSNVDFHDGFQRHGSDLSLSGPDSRIRRLSDGDGRERNGSMSSIKSDGSGADTLTRLASMASTTSATSDLFEDLESNMVRVHNRKNTLINTTDQEKTMLLQIDDDRMSIISLDSKNVILEKTFKEISYCTQGARFTDHFGFICFDLKAKKEDKQKQYVMYIFQCASDDVITEVMDTLKRAFASQLKKAQELQNCDLCPMQQFHKLCECLSSIKDSETSYNCIQNHIQNLIPSEYTDLMNKVKTEECVSYEEANDTLMTKLRILCELKQLEHLHNKESEFNLSKHQNFNVLRNRAKKALQYDLFSKNRDNSRHASGDSNASERSEHSSVFFSPLNSPTLKVAFNLPESEDMESPPCGPRPRSHTVPPEMLERSLGGSNGEDRHYILQRLSSMSHTLEEKIRGGEKSSPDKSRKASAPQSDMHLESDFISMDRLQVKRTGLHRRGSSWRRDIYDSVVTPTGRISKQIGRTQIRRSLGKEELRALWRSAVEQTVILNRMEKENQQLQADQEEIKQRRAHLDYEDVTPCREETTSRWKKIFQAVTKDSVPTSELWSAVRDGIPKTKRGDIWGLLAKQFNLRGDSVNHAGEAIPSAEPYSELSRRLTPHQHAILIDLGRTFPQHPYFKAQLGAGQLSLFNILKAYSLVDTEVGYCQGLSFLAGILLMHVGEDEAFQLLCHLMFCLGLRQQYKPDMVGLQISMYQFSRLLRDTCPEVYEHLKELDVTPSLYAAPWFLTLFASQFPVMFVARAFDMLFLEGYPAIFKIVVSMLSVHKELILSTSSFESACELLKTTLPEMSSMQMEKIFMEAMSLDVARELYTYQIEYHVFQEDLNSVDSFDDMEPRLDISTQRLREQNAQLAERFHQQTHKIRNQETMIDALQQSHAKLTSQVRALELEKKRHLTMIERLREWAPKHFLAEFDKEFPAVENLSKGPTESDDRHAKRCE